MSDYDKLSREEVIGKALDLDMLDHRVKYSPELLNLCQHYYDLGWKHGWIKGQAEVTEERDAYRATLEMRVRGLERLVRQGLKCMPVASDCPEPNVNRVDYTYREWEAVVAFTTKSRAYLNGTGTL